MTKLNKFLYFYFYLIMHAQVVEDDQRLSKATLYVILNTDRSKDIKIIFNLS